MNSLTIVKEEVQLVITEDDGSQVVLSPSLPSSIVIQSDAGPQGATGASGPPKSLTIAYPVAGDNLTLFYTQTDTTLLQVAAVLRGTGSPSVTYSLKYAANRSSAGTAATVATTVSSTTTASMATLQNMPIPANHFLWLEISAISGNPTELSMTVAV
jgi:hypothetical protein